MVWYGWVLLGLIVVLAAVAYHYWDVARAQRALVAYWQNRYDPEREKYRRLVESLVKVKGEKR